MLKDIIGALIGIIGIFLIAYGAWLIYQPLGFVVLGLALIAYSYLIARAAAFKNATQKKADS